MHSKLKAATLAAVSVPMALAGSTLVSTAASAKTITPTNAAYPHPLAILASRHPFSALKPPNMSQCVEFTGLMCYGPTELEAGYNEGPLFKKGLTGTGQTIAILDSFGSPTITSDLASFDAAFNLPAPPSFQIIAPEGAIPPFNPKNAQMFSWAAETSLDVEYSHAMAPGANILLVETPVSETIGVRGFPQLIKAENYVIDNHLANVISQSWATAEASFPSPASIMKLRSAYENAQKNGVTVVSAAGDDGMTSWSDASESTAYTKAAPNWPASDPLVTSVGGLEMHLNDAGQTLATPTVWNDSSLEGGLVAGGGGLSTVFPRPSWQDGVESIVGDARGYPDVALSAAVEGAALVYFGFPGIAPDLYLVGGTSEAAPEFAGIVAISDQLAGHGLGLLNPALYSLAASKAPGLVDVTTGNNTVTWVQNGATYTVPGAAAQPGYDLASGLGCPNAADLVAELGGNGTLPTKRTR